MNRIFRRSESGWRIEIGRFYISRNYAEPSDSLESTLYIGFEDKNYSFRPIWEISRYVHRTGVNHVQFERRNKYYKK